jgi:hypothetical protein
LTDINNGMYWHCEVAAMVLNQLPMNPCTKQHVRESIRYATLSAHGSPRFVSHEAKPTFDEGKMDSLVREHVVPVSIVIGKVLERARPFIDFEDGSHRFMPAEKHSQWRLARTESGSERVFSLGNLRAWEIAEIVKQWSVLAWVTKSEDQRLRDARLHSSMPSDWNGTDLFSRYEKCGIRWIPIDNASTRLA